MKYRSSSNASFVIVDTVHLWTNMHHRFPTNVQFLLPKTQSQGDNRLLRWNPGCFNRLPPHRNDCRDVRICPALRRIHTSYSSVLAKSSSDRQRPEHAIYLACCGQTRRQRANEGMILTK
jgi:hypothetical protein